MANLLISTSRKTSFSMGMISWKRMQSLAAFSLCSLPHCEADQVSPFPKTWGLFCCDSWDIWSMLVEIAVRYIHRTTCRQFDHIGRASADMFRSLSVRQSLKWFESKIFRPSGDLCNPTLQNAVWKYTLTYVSFTCRWSFLALAGYYDHNLMKITNLVATDVRTPGIFLL